MHKKVAVITGASSGLGRSLAIKIAEKGYNLVISARRFDKLMELKNEIESKYNNINVLICCADVRKLNDMKSIVIESAMKKFGRIDLIIANAGYTIKGSFQDLEVEDYRNLFETNFFGVLNILYAGYEYLKMTKGIAVITGSVLGEIGMMGRSVYCASKFALKGFFESVRYEFKEKGMTLILVQAGFINTELRYMDKKGERIEQKIDDKKRAHSLSANPDNLADKIVNKITNCGYRKYVTPAHAKIFVFLNWLFSYFTAFFVYKYRDFFRKKVFK